jgi:hypothetical protein
MPGVFYPRGEFIKLINKFTDIDGINDYYNNLRSTKKINKIAMIMKANGYEWNLTKNGIYKWELFNRSSTFDDDEYISDNSNDEEIFSLDLSDDPQLLSTQYASDENIYRNVTFVLLPPRLMPSKPSVPHSRMIREVKSPLSLLKHPTKNDVH